MVSFYIGIGPEKDAYKGRESLEKELKQINGLPTRAFFLQRQETGRGVNLATETEVIAYLSGFRDATRMMHLEPFPKTHPLPENYRPATQDELRLIRSAFPNSQSDQI